jgi:hypothetical protein
MNHFTSIMIIFLIPLVLSIGIAPSLSFGYVPNSPRQQLETETAIHQITCSPGKVLMVDVRGRPNCAWEESVAKLEKIGWETVIKKDTTIPKDPLEEVEEKTGEAPALETVKTRIGTLTLQSNYLTPETAKTLTDELFFQRAIQVYHLALPAVGGAGLFYDIEKIGAQSSDVIYWSNFMTSDSTVLTANISTLYILLKLDLSNGPIVIDLPKGLYGAINNIYQQPVVDLGATGPDKGKGGLYLVLPPNYNGTVPENYFVAQLDTMQAYAVARSFVSNGDLTSATNLILKYKSYNLSEADNPPKQKYFDVLGKSLKFSYPETDGFWEFLHQIYSKETVVRPEDKYLVGLMNTIGINPSQPFAPDEHSKKLLDEAAIVANLMARGIGFDSPVKGPYIYYPNGNWELLFMTNSAFFEDERGATQIDPRLGFSYQAISTSHGMLKSVPGAGSKYLTNYRDANDDWLIGSNLYKLNIPANVPEKNFWSVVVYDALTRATIKNGVQPLPGISSLSADKLLQNKDGSYDVYFGTKAPKGYENNWIKTNEGDGFFLLFRLYSPTEPYFDKSWQLPDLEKIS